MCTRGKMTMESVTEMSTTNLVKIDLERGMTLNKNKRVKTMALVHSKKLDLVRQTLSRVLHSTTHCNLRKNSQKSE